MSAAGPPLDALTEVDAALTSVVALKAALGIEGTSEDTRLAQVALDASAWISGYCQRKFTSVARTDEIYDGTGSRRLFLAAWPITAITSLYVDSTAKWATSALWVRDTSSVSGDYRWAMGGTERGKGRIDCLRGVWPVGDGNIKITYTAGYSTIPTEVAFAAKLLGMHIHLLQKRGVVGQVTNESLPEGGGSATYVGLTMPPAVEELLRKWRRLEGW